MSVRKSLLAVITLIIAGMLFVEGRVLFAAPDGDQPSPKTVIGLVLTDCEDDWKTQMYDAVQQAARRRRIQVTIIQTSRTQSDQIDAIRTLLVYRTDAIIFSPVMENGWEYILSEAEEAQIPLITINERLSQSNNADLQKEAYPVYHIGFDYYALAGQLAATLLQVQGEQPFWLVQLNGTVASSVAHDISNGFRDTLVASGRNQQNFSVNGDYMRSRAQELIGALLHNSYQFDTVLSCNDAMTLGAVDALRENGLRPGRDVHIFSLGGGESVLEAFSAGEINVLGRCDLTDFGETVIDTVLRLQDGETPDKSVLLPGTLLVNGESAV
ncbi:substrate-binding domain-containing protein [Butyricicoccus faecihominis]|uniref:substrate-binding domain-containing protein n=1 Tax=Butyricicoccus faecihominis TaxID=1712515 RepID=UPI002478A428|nr:substrate-binding domain-containing protein [Butyricicoccus faecihominis]MCQ5130158.1 substrate-binding domain-containing protein [Butyricicoccus faecihominis]